MTATIPRPFADTPSPPCWIEQSSIDAWQEIDLELGNWLRDPQVIVEADAIPPTREIIRAARRLSALIRHQLKWSAPSMVVADNAGGLAFEFHSPGVFRMVSVSRHGKATLSIFKNGTWDCTIDLALE
ncbi:MAG TPA: hypothetical protein VFC78_18775 [Tepidisphaeraceae bacterium]|nr:hypothetical protein [Tepidisphaeraceae bacterium]